MSEQAPRPDADALGDICLAAYQLPRQAEYAEDRAEAFDVTDTHEALGAQDHLLFENDPDARYRHWLVCQPLCLWTGGVKWPSPLLKHYRIKDLQEESMEWRGGIDE